MSCVFKCQVCGRVLSTAQGLKSHTTRLHKGIVDSDNRNHSQSSVGVPSSHTLVKTFINTIQPSSATSVVDPGGLEDTSPSVDVSLGALLANLHEGIKIIKRIPKGARTALADALSDTIDRCVREKSETSWTRLLLFAPVCLKISETQENRRVSLATLIKRNVGEFLQGQIPVHCEVIRKEAGGLVSQLAKKVEAKMADGDVTGAIRIMSSEDVFAPRNESTKEALLKLHPAQGTSPPSSSEVVQGPHLQVSDTETRGAIVSFRPGSAGGLDMLRPQHIKDLIGPSSGNAGIRLLSSIRSLCNIMLAAEVPELICPVLYGASLCALLKKNGGIRPIAIGSVWRRIVAKMGSHHVRSRMSETLHPIQLGFGIRGGAEAAAHAARRYVAYDHADQKVFLKVDFRNAFNTVDRDLMLRTVTAQMPELQPFLTQCYHSPSHLAYGNELLSSQQGIQQGDPLGPALFCMMVHPIASAISSELNIWYLDDAALGGHPETVKEDFRNICKQATDIGLEVNFSKCELFCISGSDEDRVNMQETFREISSDIQFPEVRECSLLGAPLVPEAIGACLEGKSQALKLISDRLHTIKAHVAFYLLKNSQAIPKLTYILRCAPTWVCEEGLKNFDSILKSALELVCNTSLNENAWDQSALPIEKGGLGMRQAYPLAVSAFLASVHSTAALTKDILPAEVVNWGDPASVEGAAVWASASGCEPPADDKKMFQREWEAPGVESSQARINERATTTQDKARLVGVASKESGAFLNVIPSGPLGTLLDNDAFRIAIALRLGSQICQQHVCKCGALVDNTGIHGLSCIRSAGRRARHAAVNDLIRRGLGSANIPAALEPSYLSTTENIRPDGITQIPWMGGKSLIWDFTCTDGLSSSHVLAASIEPLYAAKLAEENKRRKYLSLSQTYNFTPVAVECLGSIGPASLKVLRDIGRKIVGATGEKRATEYFLQRISVAVQRGNASCIMGTIPPSSSLEELIHIL